VKAKKKKKSQTTNISSIFNTKLHTDTLLLRTTNLLINSTLRS